MSETTTYNPEVFLWIDETGCDRRKLIRSYAILSVVFHLLTIYLSSLEIDTQMVLDIYIHEGSVNEEISRLYTEVFATATHAIQWLQSQLCSHPGRCLCTQM